MGGGWWAWEYPIHTDVSFTSGNVEQFNCSGHGEWKISMKIEHRDRTPGNAKQTHGTHIITVDVYCFVGNYCTCGVKGDYIWLLFCVSPA